MDDHKSLLEQSYSCLTCITTYALNAQAPLTQSMCGPVADIDDYKKQAEIGTIGSTTTCTKQTPTITCYEAK